MARKQVSKTSKKSTASAAASSRKPTTAAANSQRRATTTQKPIDPKKKAEHEKKKKQMETCAKRGRKGTSSTSKAIQATPKSSRAPKKPSNVATNTATKNGDNKKANPSKMMNGLLEAGRRLSRVEERSDECDRERSASPQRSATGSLRGRKATDVLDQRSQTSRRNKKDAIKSAEEQSTQQGSAEVFDKGVGSVSKRKRAPQQEKKESEEAKAAREKAERDERHARRNIKQREQEAETQRTDAGSDTEEEPPAKRAPRVGKNELFDLNMPAGWVHRKTKKEYNGTMRLVEVHQY